MALTYQGLTGLAEVALTGGVGVFLVIFAVMLPIAAAVHHRRREGFVQGDVEIYSDGSGGRFRNVAETFDRQGLDAAAERLRVQGGLDISVLRPTLVSFLAGPIAEHRFSGNAIWTRDDLNTAKILLDTTDLSTVQRRDLTTECLGEAQRIVNEFWGCIEVLAIRLISRRYLDADEIRECIHNVGAMGQRLLGVEVRTYKNPEMRYRPMILTLAPSK